MMDSPSRLEAQKDLHSERRDSAENGSSKHTRNDKSTIWKNLVENFSPVWFTLPMNTGVLAIAMYLLPYQFSALHTLSAIMFVFAIFLFTIIAVMTIIRWTSYFRVAIQKTTDNVDEICFLSAAPIGFLVLTSLTGLIVSNTPWGGHAFTVVAHVMWWFGTAWMLITCKCSVTRCFPSS